ncbi:MAG: hypothetical protein QNK37_37975 [Acidobacteriota bacterium]|nr:hypothetical protein [Acidobacteriota bacterium]
MKQRLMALLLTLTSFTLFAGNQAETMEEAKKLAAETGKPILVDLWVPR